MNLSGTLGLSPTSFRKVLTAHGRSTTPGLFESPMPLIPESTGRKINTKTEQPPTEELSGVTLDAAAKAKEAAVMDKLSSYQSEEMQKARDMVNLPVSKAKTSEPLNTSDSYSFYKRSFRVHGMQAWEYAMRDLGSVDTLLNRYGYVEPHQRSDVPIAPVSGDGGAGAAPAK